MKLTSFTDYALRVLIFLAARPDRRATIAKIAGSFKISQHHLTKVACCLGKTGWVSSVRGKGGGLELGMAPEQIGLGSVARLTEGEALPAECFSTDGGHCAITPICKLREVLEEAVQAFYTALDHYTLADLARNHQAIARALMIPQLPSVGSTARRVG